MNDHAKHQFCTTHWTAVLAAKGRGEQAAAALRELCVTYYHPVLHYIERSIANDATQRYGGRDANDLTQDFFTEILERNLITRLEREGGTFRSYLLGAVRHFLAHVREKETRIKRGGHLRHVSLSEEHEKSVPVDNAIFDRDWAQSTLKSVYEKLGNSPQTQKLLPWITRELDEKNRRKIADELDMSDIAVKVALHRLRKRFRETIRTQVAETVETPAEIDGELDHLIQALRHIV